MITPNLLRGEQVRLTAPTAADLPANTRWWADPDFLRLYNTAPAVPRNDDQLSRRFDFSHTSPDNFLFAIRPLDDDSLLGLLEFDGVDWSNVRQHRYRRGRAPRPRLRRGRHARWPALRLP